MEQQDFQAPRWAVSEETPLIWVTGNSNFLKQIGHIVAEAESILAGEETKKKLCKASLTNPSNKFNCLSLDDKSSALDLGRPRTQN